MNKQATKTPMSHQPAQQRKNNFDEVALGYSEADALNEASRCLDCKTQPCMQGCPVGVHIPDFIRELAHADAQAALDVIKQSNSLPGVCGRVCPQESQCESRCVRGKNGEAVAIGRLERYAADHAQTKQDAKAKKGGRVAVIGSGPAGLSCAGTLSALGHDVSVFEAFHVAGGVLMYGIPEFRLPKKIVQSEIDNLKKQGVKIELDSVVGRIVTVDELLEQGFDAVFIGTGAGLPRFMDIPGESAVGVYSANEYLTRANLMKAYLDEYDTPINRGNRVAVVGGGNVAMDSARTALRLGAEKVSIVYRRSEKEMPARAEEAEHAKQEGIEFCTLCNPTQILCDENGRVSAMRCQRMELGEPDASGRCAPVPVAGSEFDMDVDTVIMALGTSPNPLIGRTTPELELNRRGGIVTDENMRTSKARVWAGGDAVSGAATVILAMGAGRTAAADIDKYLAQQ